MDGFEALMEGYENMTDCNLIHSFRLCTKKSFFAKNYTFNAYRDCSMAGIIFDLVATSIVAFITATGNLLIPIVIWQQRHRLWGSYGVCRLWLSFCDIAISLVYLPVRVAMESYLLLGRPTFDVELVKHVEKIVKNYLKPHTRPPKKGLHLPRLTSNVTTDGPFNLQMIFKVYEHEQRNLVAAMSCMLSTYLLMVTWVLAIMSLDRYLAIVFPFKYQRWMSVKKTRAALVVTTVIAGLTGTVWPVVNIFEFYPSINNRFGFGAIFLLGRRPLSRARSILAFYLAWMLPLLVVIVFNVYTAYFCLFVMPRAAASAKSRWPCVSAACCRKSLKTVRRFFNCKRNKRFAEHICCLKTSRTSPSDENNEGTSPRVVEIRVGGENRASGSAESKARSAAKKNRMDETIEAFWTLVLMTSMFVITMAPLFILTAAVPVPCQHMPAWTWLYGTCQFVFMNQPCQHIIVYNFRSAAFRRDTKLVLRRIWSRAGDTLRRESVSKTPATRRSLDSGEKTKTTQLRC